MALTAIRVVVDAPQYSGVGVALDYLSEQSLAPGTFVRVPLGRREVAGIVWPGEPDAQPGVELRPVTAALLAMPALSARWIELVEFAARYYQRSIGELALAVVPAELHRLDDARLAKRIARASKAPAEEDPAPDAGDASLPPLNEVQAAAVAQLAADAQAGRAATTLLHGVTGSGKTEVYLREVERVLAADGQALVLVPEINLTPQLESRFAARFAGRRIVALHSGLTPAQRLRHWLAAHLGLADIVLGTRLAVFAPLPRLGVIVVDEEHDASYKQQEGARYSARDLAVWRGRNESVPVLLGSATPSLETWQQAGLGRYARLSLPGRIGAGALPRVRLFDMNTLPMVKGATSALSPPLLDAIEMRRARGEQSLVLLNRRGYAPVLHCTACGWKSACPHCSAWRVFHKLDRTLRCHHCGVTERVPRACPDCGNADITALGRGTERLEEQLAQALPGARIARIDADTTRLKGALEAQLGAVHAGEVDVLVGTQMIAKGHDFRRITLVAAVNPDGALFSSDFRAPERLFSLLLQAAGRAGRDAQHSAASEMWVQTWHPQHALYAALRAHDYAAFAASQLREREMAGLPPYAHLALLRAEARSLDVARAFLQAASDAAATSESVAIYPPVPMSLQRVANVERAQMLVESRSRPALQHFLAQWAPQLHALRAAHRGLIRWAVDVDPLTI